MTSTWYDETSKGGAKRNDAVDLLGAVPSGIVPRVLAIGLESHTSREGGLNRYFARLVAALAELGTPIVGLTIGDGQSADNDKFLETVAPVTASLVTRIRSIASGLKRYADVDIVDAHFALTALPAIFGHVRRKPLVVHFQGPWADESASAGQSQFRCTLKRRLERVVYGRASALVVLSSAFRRMLLERYGVSPWDVHVLPPGVDTESFAPGDQIEARARLRLPRDAFVAVAVRRLVPRMGLDVLLDAWAELLRSVDVPIVLVIVGTGPERETLYARRAKLGLEGVVRFAGRVDDEELVRHYRAANVSVVPSVSLEGFGLVVLESLATGTPVVASALDGLTEALEDLGPDHLVPPGDPTFLAERLRGAATGVQPLPSAEVCRRYAEGFSWTEVARRHLDLYGHLVVPAAERAVERRKLRVVVLGHTAQLSGGELAISRVVSALTDVQLHVILAQDGPLGPVLERAGASVEILPMDERTRDLRKDLVRPALLSSVAFVQSAVYVIRLARRLARINPDLVHTNSLKAALYGGMAARLARLPCVWHVRDRIAPDYLPSFGVRLARLAAMLLPDAIIANSGATLKTLPVSARARARVIYDAAPAVTSPVVLPRVVRTLRSSASASLRVAMVGRLASWKGQDVFLRAFAKAFPDGTEVAVLIGAALFGEDDYERRLRELVRDLGIGERVEFRGFRRDVFEELAQVDMLVHSSVIPEPFGQVVLEGMAAGLPVVAARAGGPAEILVEGQTGLLFPPGDVDALASLLRLLADDAELRCQLGDRARAAAAIYSPERVADQIFDVYKHVLASRSREGDAASRKRRGF